MPAETCSVYTTKVAPFRALAVHLTDAGYPELECKVSILDSTARVNGRYPVLASMVMPFAMFACMAEGLGMSLGNLRAAGVLENELPAVDDIIDQLKVSHEQIEAIIADKKAQKDGE